MTITDNHPWLSLCIDIVNRCQALTERYSRLPARGTEFLNTHRDPTMEIDVALEQLAVGVLKRRRVVATILSEELMKTGETPVLRPKANAFAGGQPVYVCMDPLDGSKAYQRDLRAFWYSCIGIYDEDGAALAGAVLDLNTRQFFFTDGAQSYQATLQRNGRLRDQRVLQPSQATSLDGCYLETYLMGPRIYLPVAARLEPLLRKSRFVVPNGGPASFCNVAAGVSDVYVELADFPMSEVFSGGLMIAGAAGCIITDLAGSPVRFDPDPAKGYSLICGATAAIHGEALASLSIAAP